MLVIVEFTHDPARSRLLPACADGSFCIIRHVMAARRLRGLLPKNSRTRATRFLSACADGSFANSARKANACFAVAWFFARIHYTMCEEKEVSRRDIYFSSHGLYNPP